MSSLALVTGAPGWLGTRLVQALIEGLPEVPSLARPDPSRQVRCLVQRGQDITPLRRFSRQIEIIEGDLTEPATLRPFFEGARGATLFHCAGIIHPTQGIQELYRVNVTGTRQLVKEAQAVGVRRLIHVSSNSPIGLNPSLEHLFDESSPYNPYMNYGMSKKLAEDIVNEAGKSGVIETVIIRPPWFYGPGQPARQALFFSMIRRGKVPIVGRGDNRRSMAYVDNICQGLLLCERVDEARGQTYWIADRRPYSMNEIVDTIERVMEQDFSIGVTHMRANMPDIVSEIARLVDWLLQNMGFYHQKIHVLSEMNKTIACSIDKARRELGYDPVVDLEEGMRRSIRWMFENGQTIE